MLAYVKTGLTEESFWLSTPGKIIAIIDKYFEMHGETVKNDTQINSCYIDQVFL
jgi:hypothetical protein